MKAELRKIVVQRDKVLLGFLNVLNQQAGK